MIIIVHVYSVLAGLSLRAGRPGISSGYYDCGPQLLSYKNRRKIESKEIPSRLIPRLLVAFTRQLEILVTTLELLGNLKPSYLFNLGLGNIPIEWNTGKSLKTNLGAGFHVVVTLSHYITLPYLLYPRCHDKP